MIEKVSIRQSLGYNDVLALQTEEFDKRIECRKNGVPLPEDIVFFVEHKPVYTLGRHGKHSHLLMNSDYLRERGIEFAEIGRGGDITYHGPGQLTVYPIIDLQRYRLGVKDYVDLLEETVIRSIAEYGLKGERINGRTGVWLGKGTPFERKISAIGIRCSRYVTMHGFALNVGPELEGFDGIVPCGLSQGVTSVSRELGLVVDLNEMENVVWQNLIRLLQPRIPFQEIS